MNWLDSNSQSPVASLLIAILLDAALKSAVVLALAGAVVVCMRRCSAAARHLVWALAVTSVLALPILSAALPRWQILPKWLAVPSAPKVDQQPQPVVQKTFTAPKPAVANESAPAPLVLSPPSESIQVQVQAPARQMPSPAPPRPHLNLRQLVLPLWIGGMALALLPILLGCLSLWRLERLSRRETSFSWLELLRSLVTRLKFRRTVALLKSHRRRMPMTWGVVRPKLLLPEESESWPAERRRVVLLHELAHAKRWDYLTNLIAQIACALYWFNPLAWIAARRMVVERERACDDIVLRHGERPADYAEQLLHIAAGLLDKRFAGYGGIAMARRSSLEGRVHAILDDRLNRAAVTRLAVIAALMLLAGVVVPVAMMRAASGTDASKPVNPASVGTQLDPLERKVSLSVERMPLKEVLAQACRAANVEYEVELAPEALELPVTLTCQDEPLQSLLGRIIGTRLEREGISLMIRLKMRGGKLVISNALASPQLNPPNLPDWLRDEIRERTLYVRGVSEDGSDLGVVVTPLALDSVLTKLKSLPNLRELRIMEGTITSNRLALIADLPGLATLEIGPVQLAGEDLANEVLRTASRIKTLRSLSLSCKGITDESVRALAGMTQLTSLSLRRNQLTDAAMTTIGGLTNLQNLDLTDQSQITERGVRQLSRLTKLKDIQVANVLPCLDLFPHLEVLRFRGETANEAAMDRIVRLRELKTLIAQNVSDRQVERIARMPWLQNLNLDGMTDAGVAHLVTLTNLQRLYLESRALSNESMRHVSRIKSVNELLVYCGDGLRSSITIEGLQQLKDLPRLRILILNYLKSPAGFLGLRELQQVRFMSLDFANIDAAEFERLKEAMPNTYLLRSGQPTEGWTQPRSHSGDSNSNHPAIPPYLVLSDLNRKLAARETESGWGNETNGLRTRLTADTRTFRAGEPVSLRLEITNVSDRAKSFSGPYAPWNNGLIVLDERGNPVPYIGGSAQVAVSTTNVNPGQCFVAKFIELTDFYHVRTPGRYSVQWPGEGVMRFREDNRVALPASGAFSFEVVPAPAGTDDGDPVGKLLPLMKEHWSIGIGSARRGSVRPGSNYSEASGRLITLQYNPTGLKKDSGLVWIWLTDEPAAERNSAEEWPPVSEYLGKLSRWHVYVNVSTNAQRAWPTVTEDVKRALSGSESSPGSAQGSTSTSDERSSHPFLVHGRVIDERGNGLADVSVTAHCGSGTLFITGQTNTDANGYYALRFAEGIRGLDETTKQWRVMVQAATISPRKTGFFEANLHRGGDLQMADKLPAPGENVGWKVDPTKVVLPNQPFELNFVMQPAATVSGRITGEPGRKAKIWINGDQLPPSSSVLAETETDNDGHFRFENVPVGYTWRLNLSRDLSTEMRFDRPGEHTNLLISIEEFSGRRRLVKSNFEGDTPATKNTAAASEIRALDRKVSLTANGMPLKDALAEVCRQARVALDLDREAFEFEGLTVEKPVTVKIVDEPLDSAVATILDRLPWDHFIFRSVQGGKLTVSGHRMAVERTRRALPDWLRPLYNNGLVTKLDDDRNVISISVGDKADDAFLARLKTLPRLRELDIEATAGITPSGLAHLAELPALENLHLYQVNRDGSGLGDDALRAVTTIRTLRNLNIGECNVTDDGVRALEGMTRLTSLSLPGNRLTDAALKSLAGLTNLQHLNLSSTPWVHSRMQFTDAGVKQLSRLTELRELSVGMLSISDIARSLPNIRSLNRDVPVSDVATKNPYVAPEVLDSPGWGEPVKGFQVRLRAPEGTVRAGKVPRLLVDVANQGSRELQCTTNTWCWQLEVDGILYIADGGRYPGGGSFPGEEGPRYSEHGGVVLDVLPGRPWANLPLILNVAWRTTDDKELAGRFSGGGFARPAGFQPKPLRLDPGKHTIRLSVLGLPKYAYSGGTVLATSNPVQIEIEGPKDANGGPRPQQAAN